MRKKILSFVSGALLLTAMGFAFVGVYYNTFTPSCTGVAADDTAAFTNLISIITTAGRTGTLRVPYTSTRCTLNNLTVPAGVTLDFATNSSGVSIVTGQTLTVVGPVRPSGHQDYFNATSGQGTVSYAGNVLASDFYPEQWGGTADNSTDNSAVITAADVAMQSGNGGRLNFSVGSYRINSAILLANDGAGTPTQKSRHWIGAGPSDNGQGGAPNGGTILDMRSTGATAKLGSRGLGFFELDHITLKDGGSASSTPFFLSTNTVVDIHHDEFDGNTGTSPTQDAIILGGTNTGASDGTAGSPFQGYKSMVWRNSFYRIQRALYVRTYGNSIGFENNNVWNSCGGIAAVEFLPAGNSDTGNSMVGNLIEMDSYTWGMKFNNQFINNTVGPNDFFDAGVSVTAFYRFEVGAIYNRVIAGANEDTKTFVSDANTARSNDIDTSHQSQYSYRTQPFAFTSTTKIVGDNNGLYTEDASGNQWISSISPSTFGHPLGITFVPFGGSPEAVAQWYRASSSDKQLIINASSLSTFSSSLSDLRVNAASGQQLCLGTSAAPCVQSLVAGGITATVPFAGTALSGSVSVTSALFKSTVAKILLQGAGSGASQLSATQTTPPTCSTNCGTSPSVVGTDTFMRVTMGATGSPASGFVVTFNGTWAAAPVCVASMATTGMAVGKLPLTVVTTTTTITVVTNGTAPANSDTYAVHCGGLQ